MISSAIYEQEFAPVKPTISQQLVHIDLRDERVQDVLQRIRDTVSGVYADAEYVSYVGTNPLGIYLEVYTAGDEFDGILTLLSERLGDLHVAAGVNVCIVPLQKRSVQAA
ncbi:MAG: hypothetical protein ACJ78Q_07715 [Chloroflexia bacterium]